MPLVRRTRATLRIAEFGFFGVVVYTRVQTPRRCGQETNAGDLLLSINFERPLRTSCCIVGILRSSYLVRVSKLYCFRPFLGNAKGQEGSYLPNPVEK